MERKTQYFPKNPFLTIKGISDWLGCVDLEYRREGDLSFGRFRNPRDFFPLKSPFQEGKWVSPSEQMITINHDLWIW